MAPDPNEHEPTAEELSQLSWGQLILRLFTVDLVHWFKAQYPLVSEATRPMTEYIGYSPSKVKRGRRKRKSEEDDAETDDQRVNFVIAGRLITPLGISMVILSILLLLALLKAL